MPFETPFPPAVFSGTINATVHEHTGAGDPPSPPITIIRSNNPWAVNVNWQTSGIANGMITGDWHLHVYLESIGPGDDLDLIDPAPGDHIKPLVPGVLSNYFVHFDVRSMQDLGVAIPLAGRLYKLVVSLTYLEPTGSPGPMAAFVEGPTLQFYNP
jgi:hypothetical protein